MLGIRFCVWGWVPVKFLCLFWRETHTKGLCARFPTRSEEGPMAEQKRAVNKRRQSTGEGSQQERVVNRSWGRTNGQRKVTARNCGPRGCVSQRERMSQHSWWLCGNFARIHACDSPQMHRSFTKVSQTSPFLLLELTQVRVCLFFFSSTPSIVYIVFCVFVKKCEIPLSGDERNH